MVPESRTRKVPWRCPCSSDTASARLSRPQYQLARSSESNCPAMGAACPQAALAAPHRGGARSAPSPLPPKMAAPALTSPTGCDRTRETRAWRDAIFSRGPSAGRVAVARGRAARAQRRRAGEAGTRRGGERAAEPRGFVRWVGTGEGCPRPARGTGSSRVAPGFLLGREKRVTESGSRRTQARCGERR